jgi:peroxiredoxin
MKRITILISTLAFVSFLIFFASCTSEKKNSKYLKKVLANLEQIESYTYTSHIEAYSPWDTEPYVSRTQHFNVYNNPLDTIVGYSYASFGGEDFNRLNSSYDGSMRTLIYNQSKSVVIDSFKVDPSRIRVVSTPFYTKAKSLIEYFINTNDSLVTELIDLGDSVRFNFTIYDDVVEIIGNQIVHDTMRFSAKGKISKYEIWINKESNIPYKILRDMPHDKDIEIVENYEFNEIKIENFRAADYFPKGYKIRQYRQGNKKAKKNTMVGTLAPNWSLIGADNNAVSLKELKSKILLIQFTGIGCGACQLSIPFLKQLVIDNQAEDFELISLESWGSKVESLKKYKNHYGINYKFLEAPKAVSKKYNVSAVPVFFILDENRIIRKVINGYGKDSTDKEIRNAINDLLN